MRLAIIGGGVIGGSLARAALAAGGAEVTMCDTNPKVQQDAHRLGIRQASQISQISGQNLAVVAVPPSGAADVIAELLEMDEHILVTDTVSVKMPLVDELDNRLSPQQRRRWIPGHPLAGGAVDANLFRGQSWVICPQDSDPGAVERVHQLVWAVGAKPVHANPAEHDQALAYTSHLVHAAACALQNGLEGQGIDWQFAGTGLKDTTRVSSGDPDLWTAIMRFNREHLIRAVQSLQCELEEVSDHLQSQDWPALRQWLAKASQSRHDLESERWQ